MATQPTRGSFPKGPASEKPEAKRLRYEEWIIRTHEDQPPLKPGHKRPLDPEYDAIKAQSHHWGKRTSTNITPLGISTVSRIKSIRAKCWQCVGGSDDPQAKQSIASCTTQGCTLWSVRPFQDDASKVPKLLTKNVNKSGHKKMDHRGKALANPGNQVMAIKGYCHTCQGGGIDQKTQQAVWACSASECALWPARAKQGR